MSSLYYKSHQNRGRQSLRQDAVLSNSSLGVAGQEQSSGLGLSAGVGHYGFQQQRPGVLSERRNTTFVISRLRPPPVVPRAYLIYTGITQTGTHTL